jgi:CubicO group peptidase (beta-lactamase class C family)
MKKLAILFSLCMLMQGVKAQNLPNFDNEADVKQWLKTQHVPTLALGIIKNGKLSQTKVYGGTDRSIFNVASLTKPVTAWVALKLVAQGKLTLDEPLYKYWTDPDIAADTNTKRITTRYVLSHQTGFKNWRWFNENKKLGFDFEPGKGYNYSGEGYEYLRKALEAKFNKPLQQLAEALIFKPLKLKDTRYTWQQSIDTSRYAKNYAANGTTYETVKNNTANAADDLLTTVEDYGYLLTALLNNKVVGKKLFATMATPQVASVKGKHFGLGVEIYQFKDGSTALAHGGSDEGVRAIFFLLPKSKDGLLIITNSDTGASLYEGLIKHYLGNYGKEIFDIEMN